MRLSQFGTLFCAVFLAACQTVPPKPIPPKPVLRAAPADQALLYLFRPELDQVDRADTPMLLVNAKPVVRLSHMTYLEIELSPGRHVIALEPGQRDSSRWRTQFALEVQPGVSYFAAVWNPKQPSARGNAVPLMVGPGVFIPMYLDGFGRDRGGAKIEPVDSDVGLDALRGLERASQLP